MSEYIVQDSSLTAVANKIREKTGGSAPLEFPDEFVAEIENLASKPVTPSDSILFYSLQDFTLSIKNRTKNWNGILEYSTDRTTWTEWDGIVDLHPNKKYLWYVLYIRGSNNVRISGGGNHLTDQGFSAAGSGITCCGNLAALLDYQNIPTIGYGGDFEYLFSECANIDFDLTLPEPKVSSFYGLFYNCKSLTKAPALPALTLEASCYKEMFYGCSSLSTPPELPATDLESECYKFMFYGCSSLSTPPELPATVMQPKCYDGMFMRSGLTVAPVLPATTMASSCYANMLSSTKITAPPVLPATTLANSCYEYMFSNCDYLISAPALPATTLGNYCYEYMFSNCDMLEQLPELPATTLKMYCYLNMFVYCPKIKLSATQVDEYQTEYRIPTTGAGTTASSAMSGMFQNTGGTFTGAPTINTTYYTANTIIPST